MGVADLDWFGADDTLGEWIKYDPADPYGCLSDETLREILANPKCGAYPRIIEHLGEHIARWESIAECEPKEPR